jgi:hypothetical protein
MKVFPPWVCLPWPCTPDCAHGEEEAIEFYPLGCFPLFQMIGLVHMPMERWLIELGMEPGFGPRGFG